MKKRQYKKNFKKALEILNTLTVIDYDMDCECWLYINVENEWNSILTVNEACGLLKTDPAPIWKDFIANLDDYYCDIDLTHFFNNVIEPKGFTTWFNIKSGFRLKPWKGEDQR